MNRPALQLGMLLLLCVLGLANVDSAAGQGSPPHTFYGAVHLNGVPVAPDTEISATIEGTVCGTARANADSEYVLDVASDGERAGCGVDGLIIHFFVAGVQADQTAGFKAGSISQLDLTAGTSAPTATPSATPTELPPTATDTPQLSATLTAEATLTEVPTERPSATPTGEVRATPITRPAPSATPVPEVRKLYIILVGRTPIERPPVRPPAVKVPAHQPRPAIPSRARRSKYVPL